MKKERFIGYLEHMRDIAAEQYYSEDAEEIVDLLNEIIEKAEQLDEPMQTSPSIPYTPPQPWWDPYKPYVTWTTDTIDWNPKSWSVDFDVDITDSICYNSKLPNPNEWSVKKDSKLPNNWKIIK